MTRRWEYGVAILRGIDEPRSDITPVADEATARAFVEENYPDALMYRRPFPKPWVLVPLLVLVTLLGCAAPAQAKTYVVSSLTQHSAAAHVSSSPLGAPVAVRTLVKGARVALPSAEHSAFPGSVRLADGRLLSVWRQGSGHLTFDGDIWGSTSSDDGRTWAPATTRLLMAGHDLRDPSLTVVHGTVWLTFCTSQPGAYGNGVYVTHSTDGADWSAPVRVDGGLPRAGESGPLMQLADGRLMQVFYGHPAGEGADSMWVTYSGDGGRTWADPDRVLNGAHDGRDYEEPWPTVTADGTVRVYLRWGMLTQIGSIDFDGTNWSNGHALWTGQGRPSCSVNGHRVLCIYRQVDTGTGVRPGLMRLSTDDGATFGPARLFDGSGTMFTYAAPVVDGAGWVVTYSVQTTWTAAQIFSRSVAMRGA